MRIWDGMRCRSVILRFEGSKEYCENRPKSEGDAAYLSFVVPYI
jgi:hypothetical protein